MRSIVIFVFITLGQLALKAQSAEDFFHNASNHYINAKMNEAKETINQALAKFPNDKKLRELADKIKEEEKKNNKDKNDQQNKDDQDDNKDKNKKDKDKNKDENKDQQKQDQNKQQQGGNKQQQQPQQNQISAEDAKRILDAMKNDEKAVQQKVQAQKAKEEKEKAQRSGQPEKNW